MMKFPFVRHALGSVCRIGATPLRILLSSFLIISTTSIVNAQTLRLGHVVAATNAVHVAAQHTAELLSEKSDGEMKLHVFPNSQLGGEREMVESIQLGNLDMGIITTAPVASFNPAFYVFDIPFLFTDRQHAYRVLDAEVGDKLLDSLDTAGLKGIGWWDLGLRHVTNSKHPVETIDDLKGFKIRTMENEMHIELWKALGTNPAPLAFGELFTALQQGTFDAQENPFDLFYDMKFHEVQKYLTMTGHSYTTYVVLINPDVWDQLGEEKQKLLVSVFNEGRDYERELKITADEDARANMPDLVITELTDEEREKFIERSESVVTQIRKKAGDEYVDAMLEAARQ